MIVKQGIAILVACCLNATFAGAQTIVVKVLERPDPTTVTVPDMAFKPGRSDLRGFDDYFYFHKSGVSYERAFTDMDQCRIQSEMAQLAPPIPRFIPLGGEPAKEPGFHVPVYSQYGVAGAIIGEIFIEAATEDLTAATGRKCMAYKGYHRYGTTRAIYKQIDSGTDGEKLARKAVIASGPPPQAEALEP